jgi:dephospho-CoA kinase
MIIGLTGPIASGKSILAKMLLERGFIILSLSEEVREEVRKRGLPIERKILQNLGNKMRQEYGNGYWAKRLIAKTEKGKNYVIEGIRNPGEIEELRKLRNFILIGVDAPIENRLRWILARDKDSDPKNLEGIRAMDARDRGVGENASGQQSEVCFQMADRHILNNTTLKDLKQKAEQLVDELGC